MDKKVTKSLIPVLKRYTIEKVSKFATGHTKNLAELLSLYPNYGLGFKVFLKSEKNDYFIIDRVCPKSNRFAKFYGILYQNGQIVNRIEKLRYVLKDKAWNYLPDSKCQTENGLNYDIKQTEELIKMKRTLLEERGKILGLPNPLKAYKEELKKKKAEAAKVPKKKF
jgi:hypothetical protein